MEQFKGFDSPNYTNTPNAFFDEILLQKGITIAEVKLLGFMIRNTFGWQKSGFSLNFSFSEIQESTFLQREAVNNAIKKCLEKGYIERGEIEGKMYYRLKFSEPVDWDLEFDWRDKKVKKIEGEVTPSSKIEPVRKSNQSQFENRTDTSTEIEPVERVATLVVSIPEKSPKERIKEKIKKNKKDDDQESIISLSFQKIAKEKNLPEERQPEVLQRILQNKDGIVNVADYITSAVENELVKIKTKPRNTPGRTEQRQHSPKQVEAIPELIIQQLERQKAIEKPRDERTLEEKRQNVARMLAELENK